MEAGLGSTSFIILGINFSVNLCKITDMNYGIKISKFCALIQQRKKYYLLLSLNNLFSNHYYPRTYYLFISIMTP